MKHRLVRWIAIITFVGWSTPAIVAEQVTICADPGPPPWSYRPVGSAGKPGADFVGSSVDFFRLVFERLGYEPKFIGDLPWARCLKMVESREIDFAMDAYFSEERATRFAYSVHYNTLTPQIFFRADQPVKAKNVTELKKLRGCGMTGASYAHFGLRDGDLEQGGNSYERMIQKLKAGRCDYFPEELEVIAGYKTLGNDYLADPVIRHRTVAWAKAPAKHLISARDNPRAGLMPAINDQLDRLIRSGEAARIWKSHTPDLPYRP